MIQKKAYFLHDLSKIKQPTNFDSIYVGNEFCQFLLPTIEQLVRLEKKIPNTKVTFVTPYLTEDKLDKISILLNYLNNNNHFNEIAVNDFGVLNLIKDKYTNLTPIIGRVLVHNFFSLKKGLRVMNIDTINFFIKNYHVDRFETDFYSKNILSKKEQSQLIKPIKISFYYPFRYLTTTRRCILANSLNKNQQNEEIIKCNRPCIQKNNKLTFKYSVIKNKIYLNGNTEFIKCNHPRLKTDKMIDRIIYDNPFE